LVYYKFNLDDKVDKFGYGVSFGVGLKGSQQLEGFIRFDRGFSTVYPNNNDHNNTYNSLLVVVLNYNLNSNGISEQEISQEQTNLQVSMFTN
jgi:hypothetical protein